MTPLTTPDTLKMINLVFGHTILSKACLKWLILDDFFFYFWDPFTTQYLTLWSPKCFVVVSIDLSERNWCKTICHILCLFQGSRNPNCWSIFTTRDAFSRFPHLFCDCHIRKWFRTLSSFCIHWYATTLYSDK